LIHRTARSGRIPSYGWIKQALYSLQDSGRLRGVRSCFGQMKNNVSMA